MQPEQREFSEQGQREFRGINSAMGCGYASNTGDTRLQRGKKFGSIASEWPESDKQPAGRICTDWQNFPTQSPVCDGDDGISAELVRYILRTGGDCYTEEEAEKEAKKIISKVRAEGIKAGGNAIVHQVALQIFKAIESVDNFVENNTYR
jgi:DNA (cytosine-5)-methyltransferase 1